MRSTKKFLHKYLTIDLPVLTFCSWRTNWQEAWMLQCWRATA